MADTNKEMSIAEAANEARKWKRFMRSFEKLGDAIGFAESAAQLESEISVRVKVLEKRDAELKASVSALEERDTKLESSTNERVRNMLDAANVDVAAIRSAGEDEMSMREQEHENRLVTLKEEVAQATQQSITTEKTMVALNAEKQKLLESISLAKQEARKLIGKLA